MKFVTVDILGTLNIDTGREVLIGTANKSKYSFLAIDQIVLINIKDEKVYITTTTGMVLICSLSVLALLKPLLS